MQYPNLPGRHFIWNPEYIIILCIADSSSVNPQRQSAQFLNSLSGHVFDYNIDVHRNFECLQLAKTTRPTADWLVLLNCYTRELWLVNIGVVSLLIIRCYYYYTGVVWWRNGRASDFRPRGQGFDSRLGRSCITTGKLFTPTCLDADSLRYYTVWLKPGTFTFIILYIHANAHINISFIAHKQLKMTEAPNTEYINQ